MFNQMSNIECNSAVDSPNTMCGMEKIHPTMARLYEAAALLKGLSGQSEVARALNMSPQRVNNWEVRGISQEGANKAQLGLGINATWILTGKGLMALEANVLESSPPSQFGRLEPEIMRDALRLLQLVESMFLQVQGVPLPPDGYPHRLCIAYQIVLEEVAGQVKGSVTDLSVMTKRLAERLRHSDGRETDGDQRGKIAGAGG